MPQNETAKKVLNIVIKVFTWLIIAVTVFMMVFTIFSVNTFDHGDRNIFGFKFFIVKTDSMSATDFSSGDIVIAKAVDFSELKVGDIISFRSDNEESRGEIVTHKIKSETTEDGQKAFITYGTTTGTEDKDPVTEPYVLGKYITRIPKVGTFFNFLKTLPGYIVCILIPFLLLIGYQGLNCIRIFRKYKKEQLEILEQEKAQIEEERKQSLEMMKEIQALKEQLARQNSENDTNTADGSGSDSQEQENN